MNPLVYIIILNWNGEEFIIECLKSFSQVKYNNYKILVVDNNSSDNYPRWSSDGSLISFTSDRHEKYKWEVYIMNVDGSNQTNLTQKKGKDAGPVFQP